jgi:hypothetical protein
MAEIPKYEVVDEPRVVSSSKYRFLSVVTIPEGKAIVLDCDVSALSSVRSYVIKNDLPFNVKQVRKRIFIVNK